MNSEFTTNQDIIELLSRRIKEYRLAARISQKEMASILKVKRSTYSLWEPGINIIPLSYIVSFADYFNYTIDYCLGLTNIKNSSNKKGLDLIVLGNHMKEIRLKNNLSQENIADSLKVTQACIVRYEKGLVCISTSNLYKFCKEFKVSMSYICGKSTK